jgi:hypothetical protein
MASTGSGARQYLQLDPELSPSGAPQRLHSPRRMVEAATTCAALSPSSVVCQADPSHRHLPSAESAPIHVVAAVERSGPRQTGQACAGPATRVPQLEHASRSTAARV